MLGMDPACQRFHTGNIEEFLISVKEAGLDSIPGTAAEILDDDVRWILTKGKLPTASWIEVISTAHKVGLPSSSTMMYGHVDSPHHWVQHLRTIAEVQDQTGGFTEFVLLPFIHTNSPIYLAGVARPGPTYDENRAVHAMSRIMLHGRIDNIQCSWVKLGVDGCVAVLTTNASPAMAPWGGREKRLGTNPWSIAAPAGALAMLKRRRSPGRSTSRASAMKESEGVITSAIADASSE